MKFSAVVSGITGAAAVLFAQGIAAHPGHSHDHWSSDLLHLGFYGMLTGGALTAAVLIRKALRRTSDKTGS